MKKANRIFIDLEFYEDGKTIELISLGAVTDDGKEFYAEFAEFVREACPSEWLQDNVIAQLGPEKFAKTRASIRREFFEFAGENPEFWADYGAYDWVALCQMYGPMIDLPSGWPMFVRDIQQYKELVAGADFKLDYPRENSEHHALHDAWDCKYRWNLIEVERLARKYPDTGMEPSTP